ncbi:MAG: hypothetical protein II038_09060 [Lachnospiraceae bacterium]|nr:hypothetical protein [Lachnospiraceae bacterium]
MSAEEEYLDRLLAQALNPEKKKEEDRKAAEAKQALADEIAAFEADAIEDTIEEAAPEAESVPEDIAGSEEIAEPESIEEDWIEQTAAVPEPEPEPVSETEFALEEEPAYEEESVPEDIAGSEEIAESESVAEPEKITAPEDIADTENITGPEDIAETESEEVPRQDEKEAEDLMALLKGDDLSSGDTLSAEDAAESDMSELEDLDLEDIERRMAEAEAAGNEDPDMPGEDADLADLLGATAGNDAGLNDIKDLLGKSDSNEALDQELFNEPEPMPDPLAEDEPEPEEKGNKKGKKKKEGLMSKLFGKKKKKGDKDSDADVDADEEITEDLLNNDAELAGTFETTDDSLEKEFMEELGESPAAAGKVSGKAGSDDGAEEGKKKPEKKKGLFAKLLEALTKDDEDENAVPEEGDTKLSDENKQILSEIDAEDEGGKGKKKKKEKKPKEKKEKKPRPKKEKKPKKEPDPNDKLPKIPKKYKIRTIAFAATVLAAALVLTVLLPSVAVMKQARNAYYERDYKNAFFSMYGKKLNDSDQLIYDRSKLIILLDRKYESYEQYKAMDMQENALDALLGGISRYESLKAEGEHLGVLEDLDAIRAKITEALMNDFGISEQKALEIISYPPADYSAAIRAAIAGESYIPMEQQIGMEYGLIEPVYEEEISDDVSLSDELPDLMPEEEEYLNGQENDDADIAEPADDMGHEDDTADMEKEKPVMTDNGNIKVELDSEQF